MEKDNGCCNGCWHENQSIYDEPCPDCTVDESTEKPTHYKAKEDNVNHPKHYEGNTSLECIDVMILTFGAEAVYHFCICNTFKYLWRHKHKNGKEDLDKASWYLRKARELVETTMIPKLEALLVKAKENL